MNVNTTVLFVGCIFVAVDMSLVSIIHPLASRLFHSLLHRMD